MILRRIASAFRRQDWFTVAVETMIVVMGVFLGLQVNNWNEAQRDREREALYLERLHADVETAQILRRVAEQVTAMILRRVDEHVRAWNNVRSYNSVQAGGSGGGGRSSRAKNASASGRQAKLPVSGLTRISVTG
jgi:hypothetical protein